MQLMASINLKDVRILINLTAGPDTARYQNIFLLATVSVYEKLILECV